MTVHRRLRLVFDALDEVGVAWCLLRGAAALEHPEGDVDILVSPQDVTAAERVILAQGFAALPRRMSPGHRFFLARGDDRAEWIKLDVVSGLSFGRPVRQPSHLEAGALERRQSSDGVQRMNPTDEFWTVALHCILDKGFVSPRRSEELAALAPLVQRGGPAEALLALEAGAQVPDAVLEAARSGDWAALGAIASRRSDDLAAPGAGRPDARKRLARSLRGPYVVLWRTSRAFQAGAGRRHDCPVAAPGRRRAAPVSVSFSGLDGAGKTRQITELRDHLAATGRSVDVVWVPFKIWPEGLLNRLPAGWRSRLGPGRRAGSAEASGPGTASAPARNGLAGSARGWAWTVVGSGASLSAGLSLRRRRRGSAADVLVLDRYRLDSIVKLQFWYAEVPAGLLARLVRGVAPAPDVEILLRVDADVAYARKPEQWTPRQLARQACFYDALAEAGGVVVLDGTADPELLAREVAHRVDAAFRER